MTGKLEFILGRLEGVVRRGAGWMARCPAHDDNEASLSITEKEGKILLHDFGGCPIEAVCLAIGLELSDLFPGKQSAGVSSSQHCNTATLTLAQYADAKKLPIDFLRSLGLSDTRRGHDTAVRIPYRDQRRIEVAVRFRTALSKGPAGDNRFRWNKGAKLQLYGLWRPLASDYVILCEGESDCHTLWYHGFQALGVPGATNWNEQRDSALLSGIAKIYVVVEPDSGGTAVKKWIENSSIRDRVHLLSLGTFKDPSALYIDDPGRFANRFKEALTAATPASSALAAQAENERATAWTQCQHLASSNSILDKFTETIRARGVVGEERNVKLLYLAVVSRFLPKPVSVAVKGPSSCGKSFLTEQVLQFFPDSAVYCLTAMSERALAYTDADLRHRFIVIYEAAGFAGELSSYFMRSLLSESRLIYEFVDKTSEGMRSRRIEKRGPTGLIVTTTAVKLHPENETRLLSLQVTDTQAQTKAVLISLAQETRPSDDLGAWIALQTWIGLGKHRVVIPFAERLADLTPPISVRIRRDFSSLLGLIRAHAILHQSSRQRNRDGAIIATPEDYSVVRQLVEPVMSEGVGATVTATIRETVAAVKFLQLGDQGASVTAVAKHLHLDKSSAARRVADGRQQGYLRNLEDRKGRPARLVTGDPMPDEIELLPSAEVLQCCAQEVEGGEHTIEVDL